MRLTVCYPPTMSTAATIASFIFYLAAAITALSAAQQPEQRELPPNGTLTVNINRADYREADSTVVLRLVATNSTTRDAVITAAQLVHISVVGGGFSLGYKKTGKVPLFKVLVVGGGRSQPFEVVSEVDLADFFSDGLEPTNLPEDQRKNARAGRLFLEIQSIDGFGKTYQNFYRIGTVAVFQENGKYVRPMVITNGKSLDAFEPDTLTAIMSELMAKS